MENRVEPWWMSTFPITLMQYPEDFMCSLECVVEAVGIDDQAWIRIVGKTKEEWLEDFSHEEFKAY